MLSSLIFITSFGCQQVPSIARLHSHLTTKSLAIVEAFAQLLANKPLIHDDLIGRQINGQIVDTLQGQQSHIHVVLIEAHGQHAI
jgi:hypothetical protein